MLKAVFDTNLIVSAALYEKSLPALLLSLGLEDKVRFFASPVLLNEYEAVLKRPRFKLGQREITELMNYKKFEELPCWIKARELSQAVFKIINQPNFRKDFSLRDQIWRAAGATMDNIAEGFDDGSTREFIRFLGYS